ncbi:hypothetical protein CRUP_029505 [Coryphaenoides rupestris]|nr:hypothetical protein CRUP_029505 [Coryphaenoides rupestris]
MEAGAPGPVLWRPGARRARKPASANIFGGVALWQLQDLFQAAGDQDADQRAHLVWGQGDQGGQAELAQALIGLRARGRRRGLRMERRAGRLDSRWLKAFHHMRIGSAPPRHCVEEDEDADVEADEKDKPETGTVCGPEPLIPTLVAGDTGTPAPPPRGPGRSLSSEGQSLVSEGRRRPGLGCPERYLHRIIH